MIREVSFKDLSLLQQITNDYLYTDKLNDFCQFKPSFDELKNAIDKRSNFPVDREALHSVIKKQYASLKMDDLATKNLDLLLDSNTFTITTGHQLNLFTGPLYFVYKILSVVSLAKYCAERFQDKNFIPIYWMASEDHDLEEIASIKIKGKKYKWNTTQTGAVGRMKVDGIDLVIEELEKVIENKKTISLLKECFIGVDNLTAGTRKFVHHLFGKYGILILDADDKELKRKFSDVLKEELFHQSSFSDSGVTSKKIEEKGYKTQVYPRPINLFYLKDNLRERIEKESDIYKVLNTSISFSDSDLLKEVNEYPERFSPNAVLRPVYQECILPNIAYVGGGAEVSYWLQLKSVFDSLKVFYPMVLMRDSAIIIPSAISRITKKLELNHSFLKFKKDELLRKLILEKSEGKILIDEHQKVIENEFYKMEKLALGIDYSLDKSVISAFVKTNKLLKNLQKKLIRAEKRKNTELIVQIERIYDCIFPNGILQERIDNVIPFLNSENESLFDSMLNSFNPLNATLKLIDLKQPN